MGLIDALPSEWRKQIRNCNFPLNIINNDEDPHMKINDQNKNIKQVKGRDIYLTFLKEEETKPNCIDAWNSRLKLDLTCDDWAYIFTLPKATICDTKVIELQFKVLRRCYATNSIISKWDKTKSEYCQICKQKANILHNFVTCTKVEDFWNQLQDKLATSGIDTPGILTPQDIIFGKPKQVRYDMLNHIIMYAKYFIHRQFVAGTKLNINNYELL